MSTDHTADRYVKITHAHNLLQSLNTHADTLKNRVAAPYLEDDTHEDDRSVYDALADYREDAGRAATGERPPLDASAKALDYSFRLGLALEDIATTARDIAAHAETVRSWLLAGLIAGPREWIADDIENGVMLDLIREADADGYADPVFLCSCLDTLVQLRAVGAVTDAAYDKHMAALYALDGHVADEPKHEFELLTLAVHQWREREDTEAALFAEPVPTLSARHAIHAATTYARLSRYFADLRGEAWEGDRRAADMHIRHIYRQANALGTDAHGHTREDAADLFEDLDAWRMSAFADRMSLAETALDIDADGESEAWADAQKTAYTALFDATDLAVTTGQLLDIWNAAAVIDPDQRANIRVGVLLHFEESRTDTGVPLVDGGAFADHTKRLRAEVDAHPVGKNSNIRHTVAYRGHRDDIADIDMRDHAADSQLARAWGRVVANADHENITRRQFRALRDLVNAKVAQWCDGDEWKAAALMSRLPEWDRITEELAS